MRIPSDDILREGTSMRLLTGVAESLYWGARYLERAESTSRIVLQYLDVNMDLPDAHEIPWRPLLLLTAPPEGAPWTENPSEDKALDWLLVDPDNLDGVVTLLGNARTNLRRCWFVAPPEIWESASSINQTAVAAADGLPSRPARYDFLLNVISDTSRLVAVMSEDLSRSEAFAFWQMGRAIEQAGMTVRAVQIKADAFSSRDPKSESAFDDIEWMSLLKALVANQIYRMSAGARVTAEDAIGFLLTNPRFPRSVQHCMSVLADLAATLPDGEPIAAAALAVQEQARGVPADNWRADLPEFLESLAVALTELNNLIEATYWRADD
ncbi:MAG: alpha-E domain-containing protein [Actinobacteria bacterium]|nr:alpha-E domain-containing protein [Actinomycetota bacterium]